MPPGGEPIALTPELLLRAYSVGVFPMAPSRQSHEVSWFDPERRGVIPLGGLHISRSLARRIAKDAHHVTLNADFARVLDACADREETWINDELADLYRQLNRMGYAHSLEVWRGDALWGAIYGITLGGAFFGESMVSMGTDGSKLALAYITHHLREQGFRLFDTQFITPHLARMGAIEIDKTTYHAALADVLTTRADIMAGPLPDAQDILAQRKTQRS